MKLIRLALVSIVLTSAQLLFGQSFSGPEEVCPSVVHTYTYSDDVVYSSVTWNVTGGGSIVSGSGLSRDIRWSSDGTVTCQLWRNGAIVSQGTKTVKDQRTFGGMRR